MARRIAVSSLNASTYDILNVIRQNAPYEYQNLVPEVSTYNDIPKVGEVLYGYPSMANYFLSALVNRIALVKVNSAVFNNAYAELKKGYLEFGETVEEVFVGIAKAREFNVEKAEARELKRTLPDVRTAFHTMNWRVQYPVTIQQEDLRMAFTSLNGVQDLIAKIVDSVYTAAEYDEYLLFKYLLIKGVSKGAIKCIYTSADIKEQAVMFRGTSNKLTFMSKEYNSAGVTTTTPKKDQYIFMDAEFNAKYDVDILSAAFNMDKAEYLGKLKLIDSFDTFDNERFEEIRANSDMIEEVTSQELTALSGIKAIICDAEWFQIYDNNNKFTEKYVASGDYWNYFYNVWKTVSYSPFSNAVCFKQGSDTITNLLTLKILDKEISENATIFTVGIAPSPDNVEMYKNYNFIQTQEATQKGIAIHKYGAFIFPVGQTTLTQGNIEVEYGNTIFKSSAEFTTSLNVGDTINLSNE